MKARREKFKEEDKLRRERIAMKEAQETILINEVIEYIKSNVSFDCKLDVIISLTSIRIQAIILDLAYALTHCNFQQRGQSYSSAQVYSSIDCYTRSGQQVTSYF